MLCIPHRLDPIISWALDQLVLVDLLPHSPGLALHHLLIHQLFENFRINQTLLDLSVFRHNLFITESTVHHALVQLRFRLFNQSSPSFLRQIPFNRFNELLQVSFQHSPNIQLNYPHST